MVAGAQMAEVAALVGDPARASMLAIMMDGRAHTAGELANAAGITAATASGHLGKLRAGRLADFIQQGRHRYYRLASNEVARMLEGIMVVTAEPAPRGRATPRVPEELRKARTCYDHLAGRLGVAITDALVQADAVRLTDGSGEITEHGTAVLADLGIDLAAMRGNSRRLFCRPCLDWSERRPHLAGVIGTAMLERFLELRWIERLESSRGICVTTVGTRELARHFSLSFPLN